MKLNSIAASHGFPLRFLHLDIEGSTSVICEAIPCVLPYLWVIQGSPARLPVLSQILHQHGGEHPNPAVQLALPEAVVRLSIAVQQADHGALGKGELLIRLAFVIVKRTDVRGYKQRENNKDRQESNQCHSEGLIILSKIYFLVCFAPYCYEENCTPGWRGRDKRHRQQ